jgi:hypothetical protein
MPMSQPLFPFGLSNISPANLTVTFAFVAGAFVVVLNGIELTPLNFISWLHFQ